MAGLTNRLMIAALAFGGATAQADLIDLYDVNSEANFDTLAQAGMSNWLVEGTDHLFQQWFWHRVGATGGETSLDTLTQLGIFATDTNPFTDPRDDTLAVLYGGTGYSVELLYTLRGGAQGSGVSDITEQIIITNTGMETLDFHFFQYCDFDIGGTAAGDTAWIQGGNTAVQQDLATGVTFTETVVTPMPSHYEVAEWNDILTSLNDASPTTLLDVAGPVSGDLTWAFQWDVVLGPGQSYIISKDKSIQIPGPAALALLGLAGLAPRRRRG